MTKNTNIRGDMLTVIALLNTLYVLLSEALDSSLIEANIISRMIAAADKIPDFINETEVIVVIVVIVVLVIVDINYSP